MGWLNTLIDEAKFAHDVNYLGPAYVLAELAAKQLESEGKTKEAKEIRATMLDSTVDAAMMAGLGKGLWGAGKALLRKLLAPIIRLGAGMAGGIGGMYAGDKLVHTLSDGKYDTWGEMVLDKTKGAIGSTLAHLSNPLAILGGFAGGWGANKAYTGTKRGKLDVLSGALDGQIENTKLGPSFIDQAAFLGKFGWAPKQTIPYRHGSKLADLKTFVPKHDRWDVVTHGADPYMYFVTDQSTPVSAANMMDRRAYQYTGNIVAEKPMVQIGEIKPAGVKNNSRNQLVARARQQGADTYIMQDIEDNQVPHLNIVARFIGPEGEAVQGGAASIKWYGPTMGKTTAAKTNPNLVDIDPLLKPIRAKHAERLGLKISDPKVSADPSYKQEIADFVLEWRANPENQGKTLVASTKHLLDPQYKVEFANEPSIPDFETFAARNKARGFKETDEQLRAWYNSILELGRDLNVDNRYVSEILSDQLLNNSLKNSNTFLGKGDKFITDPITWNKTIEGLNSEYFGEFLGSGSEAIVYAHPTDNSLVLKVLLNGSRFDKIDIPYLLKILGGRNKIPLQLLQNIEGYVLINGRKYPVVSQKKVSPLSKSNDSDYLSELTKLLEPYGFKLQDGKFTNGEITIGDMSLRNMGRLPNGDLRFIDVQKWKSGGSIHIKKKNKGKFTDYCGGKVTEECIRKGKNSSNPTTRKRANFAANARKWKHEEGGTINYLNYFK